MLDLHTEQPVTLRAATGLSFLKVNGRAPHLATLYRWASAGVRGVRLETVQIGGTRCTTREALFRFFQSLTDGHVRPGRRTPGQRRRAIERAERELDRDGI